jgi:hypothetical protein
VGCRIGAGGQGWGGQQPAVSSFYGSPPIAVTGGYLYSPRNAAPYVMYGSLPGQAAWAAVGVDDFRISPTAVVLGEVIRATASGEILLAWLESEGSSMSLFVKRLNR